MSGTSSEGQGRRNGVGELNLFLLTWPIFLELFLFMLMGSADTLMLSAVSDRAVSAVGVSNQFIFIAILILEVIGNGAAIVVSQYIGSRQPRDASRVAAIAITLGLLVGSTVSAAFLLFGASLLRAANLYGDLLANAQSYLVIVGGGLFLQALINTISAIMRAYGSTKESMLVSLGMNLLHVLGNYVLIFGHLGFPELGVKGAAVSTIVSRGVALIAFFWMLYRVMEVRIRLKDYVAITKAYVGKILKIGVPSAFESVIYQSCQSVFLYFVTFLGASALASRQYAMNISMYVFLFSMAIGMGTAIITGRLVGAGRMDEAYKRVRTSLVWGFIITVLIDLIAIVFREPLVRMFTKDPDIIRLTSQIMICSLLLETGRTFNIVLINSLRAAGDAKFTVYMGLISMVGISLPLGYLLAFQCHLGLVGIWIAIAADEWTRGVIMLYRWRSRAWTNKALVGPGGHRTEVIAGSAS